MSTFEKLNELNSRRNAIEGLDGVVRTRIKNLLDANSFVELGAFVTHRSTDFNLSQKMTPADGVVTGYGTVDGRLVYIYSQDITVLSGSIGEMNAKKIGKIYEQALKMGAPVIGVLDSKGVRLEEGLDSLEGYGEIFKYQSMASGVIPQISVILGSSLGINSIIPSLSDFVFMEQKNSKMFINSPNTLDGFEGKTITIEQMGSADVHSKQTGLAHFCFENEDACLNGVRELLNFLPSNNLEDALLNGMADDLNRIDENLNNVLDMDIIFDVRIIIESISDSGRFLEVKKEFAMNIITGFSYLNGSTVGIIANQSIYDNGILDIKACNKAVEFITFCDAFNIPIITLTDTSGYKTILSEELNGLTKNIAKLVFAFTNATVPKINIIIRQAFGSAYLIMNSKHIGADIVYAWPNAQISLMEAEAAINVIYSNELKSADKALKIEEYKQNSSAYASAKRGYVDDIIEPSQTRKYLITTLEMLESKRENRPAKKHSSISF